MSNFEHWSSNNRPYTHSKRGRMKFNIGRHTSPKVYRRTGHATLKATTVLFQPRSNFRYDEYYTNLSDANQYYTTTIPSGVRYLPFREIPGRVVTQAVGDGESDNILSKIVVDAQYDTRNYTGYRYFNASTAPLSAADPVVRFEARSTTYAGETPTLVFDLVALNINAQGGVNPFTTRIETPGGTTVSPDDINATRESLVLVCPFTKYRRGRITIESAHYLTTIRSVQVMSSEHQRKTYG
jgi:hypothetical protein